jgi:hypothetical protein
VPASSLRATIHVPVLGLVVTLAACGPDRVEQAELADVCGQPSPFRVLELSPDEQPHGGYQAVARVGNRLFWVVGDSEFVPSQHEHGYELPEHTTVIATGPCGESPSVVAHDLFYVFENPDVWPGEALGCDYATGDVFVLDAFGAREPRRVFSDVGCGAEWTEYGIVASAPQDDGTTQLRLYPVPDDPWGSTPAPVVLMQAMRTERYHEGVVVDNRDVAVRDKEILALSANDELIRIGLPDGVQSTEQTGVTAFVLGSDGSRLLWQDITPTNDDPEWIAGEVFLTDRTTGVTKHLANGSVAGSSIEDGANPPHVRVRLGKYWGDPTRIVMLPSLESIDVPDHRWVVRPVGDGSRWLVEAYEHDPFDSTMALRSLATGEETTLFDGSGMWWTVDDGVRILEVSTWIDEMLFDQAQLWQATYDGAPPELLARRASTHLYELADGRLVTALDVDSDYNADLMLVDPQSLEERLIDTHVFAFSTRYNETGAFGDAIAYAVSDGERSGVWLTALAPRR